MDSYGSQLSSLSTQTLSWDLVDEEGNYLIRAANNGISAYIDPNGIILKNIESTSKGFIDINSYKKTKKTLFSVHGNKLFLYFLIIYIILFFFLKKKGSSNEKKLSFY